MAGSGYCDIRLPKLVGDNMVLQRDTKLTIWGWGDKGEKITVNFNGQKVNTKTGKDGKWTAVLNPLKAGGPFEMSLKGKNEIVLKNILVGDVWLASGQSNMEWPLSATVNNYQQEIAEANYPRIRLFTVDKVVANRPLDDLTGSGWEVCSPETVGDFSAVAYFFGRDLVQEFDIPIGLINSSWGGTPAESWTDINSLKSFSNYYTEANKLQNESEDLHKLLQDYNERKAAWIKENEKNETSRAGKSWADPEVDIKSWTTMMLPGLWEQPDVLPEYDGVAWFRKSLEVTEAGKDKTLIINLAMIDDEDITYFNGVEIGKTVGYNKPRSYTVPANLVKAGTNVIAIRVNDTGGGGGLHGSADDLYAMIGSKKVSLAGEWNYKSVYDISTMPKAPLTTQAHYIPTGLYNAMIAPLTSFAIKGVIWYQGESNAGKAYEYRSLFTSMIEGWREQWGYEFPFLFVQLANYMYDKEEPADYAWAELREAQTMALSLPKTGMAIAIDIGNPDDIHPRNKQDVGKRLALAAKKVAYNQDIVHSGPVYNNMTIEDGKVRISFTNTGSGLQVKDKYGYVRGFAIAGADKKFVWAKGYRDGNDLIIYHDDIEHPVAVRYNWSNNPDGNVYNEEGLPAVPFRTDDFDGITKGK